MSSLCLKAEKHEDTLSGLQLKTPSKLSENTHFWNYEWNETRTANAQGVLQVGLYYRT